MSGITVDASVTFEPFGNMTEYFSAIIIDDNVALERDEIFEIGFTGSLPSNGVMLGPNTQVTISDDDCKYIIVDYLTIGYHGIYLYFTAVSVNFNRSVFMFSEDSIQSSGIEIILSNPIAQDLSVEVFAG